MLKIKIIMTEAKNAFDGPVSGVDTAKKGISASKNISIETSKTENQGEQWLMNPNRISKDNYESESDVTQLCPTLCYPMDCSSPGFPSMGFSKQQH